MPSGSLIFTRRPQPKALSLLPLFIVLSLAAHIGALVVFQILYPSPSSGVRRSAEVYFLRPDSAEAGALEPLLEATDPALYSRFQTDSRTQVDPPPLEYVPSFDLRRPELSELPPEPLVPEKSVQFSSTQPTPAPAAAAKHSSLRIDFSEKLHERRFESSADPAPVPPAGEIPESPVFSLAVAADGRPLYLFLEHGSGLPELDAAARTYLLRGRFAPAENEAAPPVWGRATFLWPRPAAP